MSEQLDEQIANFYRRYAPDPKESLAKCQESQDFERDLVLLIRAVARHAEDPLLKLILDGTVSFT